MLISRHPVRDHQVRGYTILACAALALGGCATVEETVVQNTARTFNATLTGARQVGGGDPDGYARAQVSVSDRLDRVCYQIEDVRGLAPITGAAIHRGELGKNGPVVLTLDVTGDSGWTGCVSRKAWSKGPVPTDFSVYYISIATSEFPNGAIRGQFDP